MKDIDDIEVNCEGKLCFLWWWRENNGNVVVVVEKENYRNIKK